jgi:hypothetical protein
MAEIMTEKKLHDQSTTVQQILKAFDAGVLQAKIDAVRFNTDLIVTRNGKLTHIPPDELIPDLEAAGLEIIIVRPKQANPE